ncbi:MAG: cytochrome c peroxidase [Verrucomicrobiota bacterium JB023]|nr:cytochrome c peroxidase [Verrucomicrobiota bacterium JB023]
MKSLILISSIFLAQSLSAHFESRPVHPLALNAEGSRLYATNAAEARLSVFAIGPLAHTKPLLIAEVPVGLSPVSVRLRNEDEAWVVCELSDSITVVDLRTNQPVSVIQTGDEPSDVVFTDGKAFVTCARDNAIEVFSSSTREPLGTIALEGVMPRSLALSPDGQTVHAAFLLSGNNTTILPRSEAPAQPAPTDPDLPEPPQVGLIVSADDERIPYTVTNHDVAHISVADLSVTYTGSVGTNLLGLHPLPSGDLLVANTEARNLIRFEPELKARFVRNRLTRWDAQTGDLLAIALDSDPDTIPTQDEQAASLALAQPMAITSDQDNAYVAAFGSDRIGVLDLATNALTARIDLRSLDGPDEARGPLTVRGPRGLALHPVYPRLYCFNKLSHTLSIVDTDSGTPLGEIALSSFTDLEPDLKMGRAFLHDARLSGNGSASCASCHIDLERDGLAWDLGDPGGSMVTVSGVRNSLHDYSTVIDYDLHPMKGPLVTQTLIGIHEQTPLHWRGDKDSIQSFNSTFVNLLGGALLADDDMDRVAAYLETLRHHPNPNLNLDRSLPATLQGGDPTAGISVYTLFDNHCAECHRLPSGSSNNHDIPSAVGSDQALKDPPLRTTFHRMDLDTTPGGESRSGFGMLSDGSGSVTDLPIGHDYFLHILDDISRPAAKRAQEKLDLTAFLLCFDTGTAPVVGHTLALTPASTPDTEERASLTILEAQAVAPAATVEPAAGLVLRGIFRGEPVAFQYRPADGTYRSTSLAGANLTFEEIHSQMLTGDLLLASGVPYGTSSRFSIDRDQDESMDSTTPPLLTIQPNGLLAWPATQGWYPESTSNLLDWRPDTRPQLLENEEFKLSPEESGATFTRLKRTW